MRKCKASLRLGVLRDDKRAFLIQLKRRGQLAGQPRLVGRIGDAVRRHRLVVLGPDGQQRDGDAVRRQLAAGRIDTAVPVHPRGEVVPVLAERTVGHRQRLAGGVAHRRRLVAVDVDVAFFVIEEAADLQRKLGGALPDRLQGDVLRDVLERVAGGIALGDRLFLAVFHHGVFVLPRDELVIAENDGVLGYRDAAAGFHRDRRGDFAGEDAGRLRAGERIDEIIALAVADGKALVLRRLYGRRRYEEEQQGEQQKNGFLFHREKRLSLSPRKRGMSAGRARAELVQCCFTAAAFCGFSYRRRGGIPSSRRADMGCANWNAALLLSLDSAFAEPEAGKLEWLPQGLGLVRNICGHLITAGLGVCRAGGRQTRMAAARTRACA